METLSGNETKRSGLFTSLNEKTQQELVSYEATDPAEFSSGASHSRTSIEDTQKPATSSNVRIVEGSFLTNAPSRQSFGEARAQGIDEGSSAPHSLTTGASGSRTQDEMPAELVSMESDYSNPGVAVVNRL